MVRARLHIICGNCGCNDEFRFKIDPEGHDITDKEVAYEPAVYISCKNCTTLHDLSDTIPEEKEDKDKITSAVKTLKHQPDS